jgi:hypothetical protein
MEQGSLYISILTMLCFWPDACGVASVRDMRALLLSTTEPGWSILIDSLWSRHRREAPLLFPAGIQLAENGCDEAADRRMSERGINEACSEARSPRSITHCVDWQTWMERW